MSRGESYARSSFSDQVMQFVGLTGVERSAGQTGHLPGALINDTARDLHPVLHHVDRGALSDLDKQGPGVTRAGQKRVDHTAGDRRRGVLDDDRHPELVQRQAV